MTLAQNTLRGIARVLTFEHPELKTTIVDVEAEGSGSADALIDELCADGGHDEVAVRDGQRYVNWLVRVPVSAEGGMAVEQRPVTVDLDGVGAVRLQIDRPGRLGELAVHAVRRMPLAADQVEVRVVAAGLNSGDVLKAMGLYPALDNAAPVLGSECVGYVTGLGARWIRCRLGSGLLRLGLVRLLRI